MNKLYSLTRLTQDVDDTLLNEFNLKSADCVEPLEIVSSSQDWKSEKSTVTTARKPRLSCTEDP